MTRNIRMCLSMFVIMAAALSTTGVAQGADTSEAVGGPFTGSPVVGAPFSAEATTTLTQTLGERTHARMG